jgi:hypothetical protein
MVVPLTPATDVGVNTGSLAALTPEIAAGRLPQTRAVPNESSAIVPSAPATINLAAAKEVVAGAEAGADVVFPVPSCPTSLLPQQRTPPLSRTAQACRAPTLTERAGSDNETATGGPSNTASNEGAQQ